jgi:hypothetical protein
VEKERYILSGERERDCVERERLSGEREIEWSERARERD